MAGKGTADNTAVNSKAVSDGQFVVRVVGIIEVVGYSNVHNVDHFTVIKAACSSFLLKQLSVTIIGGFWGAGFSFLLAPALLVQNILCSIYSLSQNIRCREYLSKKKQFGI